MFSGVNHSFTHHIKYFLGESRVEHRRLRRVYWRQDGRTVEVVEHLILDKETPK
jgi:hypothetical protein